MTSIRRTLGSGLVTMATVALMTAIWPGVASVVLGLLITVLSIGAAAPIVLVIRWVRGELVWRRELRSMPPVDAARYGPASMAPALGGLRKSA